jgi:hypothetical protein
VPFYSQQASFVGTESATGVISISHGPVAANEKNSIRLYFLIHHKHLIHYRWFVMKAYVQSNYIVRLIILSYYSVI